MARPASAVVAALIAIFAVGAPAALANETPDPAVDAAGVPEAPPAPPVAPEIPDVPEEDPPTVPTPPVDPPTVDPPPAPAPETEPPPAAPPATVDPPSEAAADPAPPPPPPAVPQQSAVAENTNRVIQVVWQVQRGCRRYCRRTSQSQTSVQRSETSQRATAISHGGSFAGARNESSTFQFVWQEQFGCESYCFDTSQTQEASQHAHTDQTADAQSALAAWAENLAEVVQYVFQTQWGCEHECHGTSQSQRSSQSQSTRQSATANSAPPDDGDGSFVLPDWLIAYARNLGATIQTIRQYQEALCLEYCDGDTQIQWAEQDAGTSQSAVAMAPPPPPPPEPPPGQPPVPPTDPRPPAGTGAPTDPSVAVASAPPRRVLELRDSRARRTARRMLVLRLERGTPAGGSGEIAAPGSEVTTTLSAAVRTVADQPARVAGAIASATPDERPARTSVAPLEPEAGGSTGWMAMLLAAAALGLASAAYRSALASWRQRI